jgi:hypothetical protein
MLIANISIDLTKIDKDRILEHKNGAKYYSLDVIINDTANEWGQDVSVKQSQTKEEKERKDKFIYIGNGKVVYRKDTVPAPKNEIPAKINEQPDNDLPF